ncbi:MAG: NADH-quinone oxidoreductase subunit NuoK [Deferribacterota bacterium]|nr:NADH-quinone oxidoreductase subunit NuoK [Deferribacterota bacterium]
MTLEHYLVLSAVIFGIGMAGVLLRRNLIIIFISLELMLNAVNINLAAFSKYLNLISGEVFIIFIMAVAAAEAAVGLALIVSLYRNKQTIDSEAFKILKW